MSAATEHGAHRVDSAPLARAWHLAVPAVISVAAFLVLALLLSSLAGRPWGPTYPLTMDALVLARMGPIYFSALIVWPAMRARGASAGQATLGILATPIAFAIVSAWNAASFFPPLEAVYYATNPMVIGAIGAQISSAGVGALGYRMWRARRITATWGPIVAIVAGSVVTFVAVMWDGGQHLFYPWVLVYGHLFG